MAPRDSGSMPSSAAKPTGRSAEPGSTIGLRGGFEPMSRIWICTQLLHSSSYNVDTSVLSPFRWRRSVLSFSFSKLTSGRHCSSTRSAPTAVGPATGGCNWSGARHCAAATVTGQSVVS